VLPAVTPESATDFFGFGIPVAGAVDSDIGFSSWEACRKVFALA
jgi:hypothetical protein